MDRHISVFNLSCFDIDLYSMYSARRWFQVSILISISMSLVKLSVNIDSLRTSQFTWESRLRYPNCECSRSRSDETHVTEVVQVNNE